MKEQEIEYLMASQIAEMLGGKYTRPRVHTEMKRGNFPQPDKYINNSPLWSVKKVHSFMKSKGMTVDEG